MDKLDFITLQKKVRDFIRTSREVGLSDGEITRELLMLEYPADFVKKLVGGERFSGKILMKINNLSKEFILRKDFRIPALGGVNLDIRDGEFLSITGPSGSGKSTLLNLIGLIDNPTSGEILISPEVFWGDENKLDEEKNKEEKKEEENELGLNNKIIPQNIFEKDISSDKNFQLFNIANLKESDRTFLRLNFISFIFQFYNLLSNYSALENIVFPLRLQGYGRRDSREKASGIINFLGLKDRADYYPEKLSGGEQQRVAVGRAVARNAKIILADEPTAHLDSKNSQEIINLLRDINVKFGKTIILVTHELEYAGQADRMIVLKDGLISDIIER